MDVDAAKDSVKRPSQHSNSTEHPCSAKASTPGSPVFTCCCSRTHTEETGLQISARVCCLSVPMVTLAQPRRALCSQNSRNDPPKRLGTLGRPWPTRGKAAGCSGSQGQAAPTNRCVCGSFPKSKGEEGRLSVLNDSRKKQIPSCHRLCCPQGPRRSNSFDSQLSVILQGISIRLLPP